VTSAATPYFNPHHQQPQISILRRHRAVTSLSSKDFPCCLEACRSVEDGGVSDDERYQEEDAQTEDGQRKRI